MFGGLFNNKVNQANARATVIAGRDATTILPATQSALDKLQEKLLEEVATDKKIGHIVESLRHFYEKHSEDGIEGLENKLIHVGRGNTVRKAMREKEYFSKLLEKYTMYESAQEIFALMLAKVDYCYNTKVYDVIDDFSSDQFTKLFDEEVIAPIIQECVSGVFTINHKHAMGMFYWLAEQCFVRWHK